MYFLFLVLEYSFWQIHEKVINATGFGRNKRIQNSSQVTDEPSISIFPRSVYLGRFTVLALLPIFMATLPVQGGLLGFIAPIFGIFRSTVAI